MYTRQRTTVVLAAKRAAKPFQSVRSSTAFYGRERVFNSVPAAAFAGIALYILLEAALLAAVILTERLFQLLDYAAPSFSSSTMTWLQNGS